MHTVPHLYHLLNPSPVPAQTNHSLVASPSIRPFLPVPRDEEKEGFMSGILLSSTPTEIRKTPFIYVVGLELTFWQESPATEKRRSSRFIMNSACPLSTRSSVPQLLEALRLWSDHSSVTTSLLIPQRDLLRPLESYPSPSPHRHSPTNHSLLEAESPLTS